MQDKDYGLFIQRMRKSRGITQEDLAAQSGVSSVTIRKLESSGETIVMRPGNLDAILTALSQKAPLGESEIATLCEATNRRHESFESLNNEADRRNRATSVTPSIGLGADPTLEERIGYTVQQLLSAGLGELALAQLEALAKHHGDQIAEEERTDTTRRVQVRHPERKVGDTVYQDITHYKVVDDHQSDDDQSTGVIS